MTVTHKWSGDGLAAGTLTTSSAGTGDTAFTTVNGTGLAIHNSGVRPPRLQLTKPVGGSSYAEWVFASRSAGALRFYWVSPTAVPGNSFSMCRVKASSTNSLFFINVMTNGNLRILNSAGTQLGATGSGAIAFNGTRYRVEAVFQAAGTSSTATVYLYLGDATTATHSFTVDPFGTGTTETTYDRVHFGLQGTTPEVGVMYFDDMAVSDTATLIGTALPANVPPTASAGPDQTVAAGATVTLTSAASSDSDGTIASRLWAQTSGTAVTLSSTTATSPTFTAPATAGVLTFSVTVTDNDGATATDSVSITVTSTNTPPFADLTGPTTLVGGQAFTLTVSATDPGGSVASAVVTQIAGPTVTLSGSGTANRTGTAPFVLTQGGADLTFRLTVTDNLGATDTDDHTIHIARHTLWRRNDANTDWIALGDTTPNFPEPPVEQDPYSIAASVTEVGDGYVIVGWTVTPGGYDIDGVWAAHGAPSPWESALRPGLTGTQRFGQLTNGTQMTFTITPSVGGLRDDAGAVTVTGAAQAPVVASAQITDIGTTLTNIADPDSTGVLKEVSGIAGSLKNSTSTARVFWAVNDQGDNADPVNPEAAIYCFDDISSATNGRKVRHQLTLTGITNENQFEDIAEGPGPVSTNRYIYAARIGAGAGTFRIYRVSEPAVTPGQALAKTAQTPVVFTFTMPFPNAESFFVDPISGDGFVIEKNAAVARPNTARVLRLPGLAAATASATITGTVVATITANDANTNGSGGPTYADITRDGKTLVVGNYQEMWVWNLTRSATATIGSLLTAQPTGDVYQSYAVGVLGTESLAFDPSVDPPLRAYSIAESTAGTSSLKYIDLTRAAAPPPPPPPPEPGTALHKYGIYLRDGAEATFGSTPGIYNIYVQPPSTGYSGWNTTAIRDNLHNNVSVNVTLTLKNTQLVADYAGVNGAAAQAAADSAIDGYFTRINAAITAAEALTGGIPDNTFIYATICHEHDVYSNPTRTDVTYTGQSGDPTTFGKALARFYTQGRAKCGAKVKFTAWFGGTRTDHIGSVLTSLVNNGGPNAYPDGISEDPYVNQPPTNTTDPAETPTQNFGFVSSFRSATGIFRTQYNALVLRAGKAIWLAVSEHGISKERAIKNPDGSTTLEPRHNDSQMAKYHDAVDEAIVSLNLEYAVFFNRDSGPNGHHRVDDGSHPLAVAAVSRAMAALEGN